MKLLEWLLNFDSVKRPTAEELISYIKNNNLIKVKQFNLAPQRL